jgi:hypothetical protein
MKNEKRAGQEARMACVRKVYKVSIRICDEMTHYFAVLGVRRKTTLNTVRSPTNALFIKLGKV